MAPMFPQLDVNIPEGWWKQDAQLDLDFANKRAYNKFTQFRGRPDSILTYTSPSPKMVYDVDGVLRYAPHNRFLYSEDLSAASWSKIRGSATADKFSCDSTADANHSFQQNVITAGVDSVLTVELKPAEITTVFIQLGGTTIRAVNLSTGAMGSYSLGTSTASLVAADDGYYLLTLSGVPSNTNLLFFAGEGDGSTLDITLAGVRTGEGFYARKLQVSCGTVAFDYIPTTSAAVYSLPIDHDPITHAPLGVLIEEQRTNLLTYSEQFDNAAWTKSRVTVTPDAVSAPTGVVSGDKLAEDNSTGVHEIYSTSGVTLTAAAYTASVFLKSAERTKARLTFATSGGAQGASVIVDLAAGTLGTVTDHGSHTGGTATIQELPDGWYRVSLTITGTAAVYYHVLATVTGTSTVSYTGTTGSGVYQYGAQLEAGAFPTSYIPTVASQVTRAADQVSILTSAFGYSATAGTVLVEGSMNGNGAGNAGWWALDAGAVQNGHSLRVAIGNNILAISRGASSNQTVVGLASAVAGTFYETAFAYSNENDRAISTEGGAVVSGSTAVGTINSATTLRFGFQQVTTTGGYLNGHIKRLTYFSTRKTDSELQGLTI